MVLSPAASTVPLRRVPLPFYRPELTDLECEAVLRALKSGWLTTGQECARFETELADYLQVPTALALNSCTAGLHLGPGV